MGAKRSLSLAACNHLQEVPLKEELHSAWSWLRVAKVSLLTFICAFLVFLLLFFPEEKFDLNLITVDRVKDFQFDVDNLYQSSDKGPYAKILDVTIQVFPSFFDVLKSNSFKYFLHFHRLHKCRCWPRLDHSHFSMS